MFEIGIFRDEIPRENRWFIAVWIKTNYRRKLLNFKNKILCLDHTLII